MRRALFILICLLSAAGFAVAPYLVFQVAEPEETMGFIQKIFYFHVPCAWNMLLSAIVCGVGGGAYLFTRKRWADELLELIGERYGPKARIAIDQTSLDGYRALVARRRTGLALAADLLHVAAICAGLPP